MHSLHLLYLLFAVSTIAPLKSLNHDPVCTLTLYKSDLCNDGELMVQKEYIHLNQTLQLLKEGEKKYKQNKDCIEKKHLCLKDNEKSYNDVKKNKFDPNVKKEIQLYNFLRKKLQYYDKHKNNNPNKIIEVLHEYNEVIYKWSMGDLYNEK